MRLILKRIGTWALLATVIVFEYGGWIREKQCKNFSAKIVYVSKLRTEEAPLSKRKRISFFDGVEVSVLDCETYRVENQLEEVIALVIVG